MRTEDGEMGKGTAILIQYMLRCLALQCFAIEFNSITSRLFSEHRSIPAEKTHSRICRNLLMFATYGLTLATGAACQALLLHTNALFSIEAFGNSRLRLAIYVLRTHHESRIVCYSVYDLRPRLKSSHKSSWIFVVSVP